MKSMILKSAVCVLAVVLVCGCAGTKKPSDQELIQGVLQTWKAAMEAKDLTKGMTVYSEKFSNYEIPDKVKLKGFFQDAIDMGYLEGAKVDLAQTKTTIEETKATVYPIDFRSDAGQVTIELTLTKEAAGWLITGMNIEGM